jgi:hyperosmotically inducible periplasmic protein
MKAIYPIFLMVAAVALLALSVPLHASEIDARIESSARNSYIFATYLNGDSIEIKSTDGVVALTGVVSKESHKTMAQETMASLPGVKSVDNRLEVKDAPPSANSDAWLGEKVRATLLFHRSVSASKTELYVNQGVVTLRGEATSESQKELTAEYAKDVEGVKEVKNEMTLSKTKTPEITLARVGGKIDDASITAQVKITLLFHRSTSALSTKVETNDGVVTLYGKASNAAEKDLVSHLVNDIHGVKSVNNLMTIE